MAVYRFVFLQACNTANDAGWARAFGIEDDIHGIQVMDVPDCVQAFVGWMGECMYPGTEAAWDAFGVTLNQFVVLWQSGYRLDVIVRITQTSPQGGYPLQGRYKGDRLFIYGYDPITRTGFAQ